MGYTTEFEGVVTIDPPLNEKEVEYLNKFSETRRMVRRNGPYYIGGKGDFGQAREEDVIDYNKPPDGQPGLWCQWVASNDGTTIEWDFGEKFYHAAAWMEYIIEHFFGSDPIAKQDNEHFDFLQGHTINGTIEAIGEERDDLWKIVVTDNKVEVLKGTVTYGD